MTIETQDELGAEVQARAMRVAVLGAFPFPYPQGSQVYATDHTRALMGAGVDVSLFTYGSGIGATPRDLDLVPSPGWLSPRIMRSGPTLAKIPADAALLQSFVHAHRERRFDVVLAHNVEAAIIGLAARPFTGTPVIYIAHTILRYELAAYAARRWESPLCRIGLAIDRFIARRVDGIIVLCEDAERVLAPYARGPIEITPRDHPMHHRSPRFVPVMRSFPNATRSTAATSMATRTCTFWRARPNACRIRRPAICNAS